MAMYMPSVYIILETAHLARRRGEGLTVLLGMVKAFEGDTLTDDDAVGQLLGQLEFLLLLL